MSDRSQLGPKDVLSNLTTFPNPTAEKRLAQLVGLEDHIEVLTRDLRLIFDPEQVDAWSEDLYGKRLAIVEWIKDAVPLVVFEGDVGTGKTALAETVGQRVAEDGGFGVHLVKMNTQVRGSGYVGEMGTLIAGCFREVKALWEQKGEPVIFLMDEADSVLTSRETVSHHHEDKAGVNTILQHLDDYRASETQIAVIAITNRGGVLDPAVRRRAATVLRFARPDRSRCEELLRRLFEGALTDEELAKLTEVAWSADQGRSGKGYTYSDLTLRFAIPATRQAVWEGRKLDGRALAEQLRAVVPTPRMRDPARPCEPGLR